MKKRSVFLSILIACVAAGLIAAHSAALSVTTNAVSFPGFTLDGVDHLLTGSTTNWQVDATGETGGWHATIAATDFSNGSGGAISVSNLSFRLQDANINLVSGDATLPASLQTNFVSLSTTPLKFISAGAGTGDGVYDFLPEFQLLVPAETYTGNYATTITISVATGP